MKTLTLKRPKTKEKLYSEAIFKIFANDKFVEKIGQDEIKKIESNESSIEIVAKHIFGNRSQRKIIELTSDREIEILANTKIGIHPLIIFGSSFPFLMLTINFVNNVYFRITGFTLFAIMMIFGFVQWYRYHKNGILINEIK